MDTLKLGKRKTAAAKVSTPFSAFEQGSVGESRINQNQCRAIEALYHSK